MVALKKVLNRMGFGCKCQNVEYIESSYIHELGTRVIFLGMEEEVVLRTGKEYLLPMKICKVCKSEYIVSRKEYERNKER